jgi:regulator of RNase E activity RraA
MRDSKTLYEEAMEILKKVSTGMVVDALAMSGIQGGIMGIRPARGFEDFKIMGPAVTVLFDLPHPDSPELNIYRVIHESPAGSVLVIDGKGFDGHFTGDNQAEYAKRQGLEGIVVNGGARDIAGFRKIGLPLYCTGSATRDKPRGFKLIAYKVPIEIGEVLVKPDDIILADEDGVACVPEESIENFIEKMKTIFEVEAGMEKAMRRNASVEELLAIISQKRPKV